MGTRIICSCLLYVLASLTSRNYRLVLLHELLWYSVHLYTVIIILNLLIWSEVTAACWCCFLTQLFSNIEIVFLRFLDTNCLLLVRRSLSLNLTWISFGEATTDCLESWTLTHPALRPQILWGNIYHCHPLGLSGTILRACHIFDLLLLHLLTRYRVRLDLWRYCVGWLLQDTCAVNVDSVVNISYCTASSLCTSLDCTIIVLSALVDNKGNGLRKHSPRVGHNLLLHPSTTTAQSSSILPLVLLSGIALEAVAWIVLLLLLILLDRIWSRGVDAAVPKAVRPFTSLRRILISKFLSLLVLRISWQRLAWTRGSKEGRLSAFLPLGWGRRLPLFICLLPTQVLQDLDLGSLWRVLLENFSNSGETKPSLNLRNRDLFLSP